MTFALQVFIASSIFCVVVITLLLMQKKGYLRHLFFTISMLLSSMLFLIAASAFFYYEYSGYTTLARLRGKNASNLKKEVKEFTFSATDIDVLEGLHHAKNTLIGYENFLIESAQNYNPQEFSYENLLKEQLISQFEKKEYNLEY